MFADTNGQWGRSDCESLGVVLIRAMLELNRGVRHLSDKRSTVGIRALWNCVPPTSVFAVSQRKHSRLPQPGLRLVMYDLKSVLCYRYCSLVSHCYF